MTSPVVSGTHGKTMTKAADFHAHLDECKQCRDHPFALCATGAKILKEAATNV